MDVGWLAVHTHPLWRMGNSGLGMSSLGPEATVKVYGAEADRLARRRGRTPPLFAILDYAATHRGVVQRGIEGAHVTESSTATGGQQEASKLDTNVPHSARIWNYWLGGKDNFAADRAVGDRLREVFPEIVEIARASRAFLVRAVTYLAGEEGIRQFLDVGTGLPTDNNTHEVAQRVAPESRIVYVDNDPLVLVHARALLTSSPEGATDYIDADVREPDKILQAAAQTLDFTKPVGLMALGILGYVAAYDEARSVGGDRRTAYRWNRLSLGTRVFG